MKVKRKTVEGVLGLYTREYPNAEGGITKLYYGRISQKSVAVVSSSRSGRTHVRRSTVERKSGSLTDAARI